MEAYYPEIWSSINIKLHSDTTPGPAAGSGQSRVTFLQDRQPRPSLTHSDVAWVNHV